jgi:hypothetical protein
VAALKGCATEAGLLRITDEHKARILPFVSTVSFVVNVMAEWIAIF